MEFDGDVHSSAALLKNTGKGSTELIVELEAVVQKVSEPVAALKKLVTAPVSSVAPSMLAPSSWVAVFGASLLFIFGYSIVASGREKLARADK